MSKEQLSIVTATKLLKDVSSRTNRSKEISKLKGENFNLFSILGMESNENKTHSRFIASLLDPSGPHDLNNAFLISFIKHLQLLIPQDNKKNQILENLLHEQLTVKTEDIEGINYGRADISIRGKSGVILIENKIYAQDSDHQLAKYCLSNKDTNVIVFYLTLHGQLPSDESTETPDKSRKLQADHDFFLISYKEDIKKWITHCLKESADFPIMRESIKQYLILIKKLTGQLTNQKDMEELKKVLINNYESATLIADNMMNIRYELISRLFYRIKDKLEKNFDDAWKVKVGDVSKKWHGISLQKESWDSVSVSWCGNPYLATSETVLGITVSVDNNLRSFLEEKISDSEHSYIFQKYKVKTNGWMALRRIYLNDGNFIRMSKEQSLEDYSKEIAEEFISLAHIVDKFLINSH